MATVKDTRQITKHSSQWLLTCRMCKHCQHGRSKHGFWTAAWRHTHVESRPTR